MIDGGAFWTIIGDNAVKYLHNVRACEPKPIVTGSGLSWLDMQGDLMLRNDELKSCLINPGMPMSVVSEGELTHSRDWKTSRSKFGTIITGPSGLKDMAYRVGNVSYMPESMLAEVTNVPTPLKTGPAEPAQGEGDKEDFCMPICGEVENKEVPTNSGGGQMRRIPTRVAAGGHHANGSDPNQEAAWDLCKRTGCPCDSWNGEHDEFCCLTCKSGKACKARYHVHGYTEPKKVRLRERRTES